MGVVLSGDEVMNRELYFFMSSFIKEHPVLSKEEEKEVLFEIQNGNQDAYFKLINHNYCLILSACKGYRFDQYDFNDLFQDGVIGLMKAAKKFDLKKDICFSTYAMFWIHREIRNGGYSFSSVTSVPLHVQEDFRRYQKRKEKLFHLLGREIEDVSEIAYHLSLSVEKVLKYEQLGLTILSLDDESCFDTQPVSSFSVFDEVFSKMRLESFLFLLSDILDDREYQVITSHFGIFDEKKTVCEICRSILKENGEPVSRGMIQKLEKRGVRKLLRRKKDFLDLGIIEE